MAAVKMARAATITRLLKAAGMRKGEDHASGMVRGWHTYSAGFVTEQVMEHGRQRQRAGNYRDGSPRYTYVSANTQTGYVEVHWQFSTDTMRPQSHEERAEVAAAQMARAAQILRDAGYDVEETDRGGMVREVSLKVSRKDADGNIVVTY